MIKNIVVFLAVLLLFSTCKIQNNMIDNSVVSELDINRYLGKWYEIARFDHSFERELTGVTATYSFRDDGKIKVVNAGFKGNINGKKSQSVGKAIIPDRNTPAKIKVSFFWFFYADYFVMELDKDYKWAVVGSSSDKYLWILSRTPQLDINI